MAFFLFLLVNATLFIRPAEIIPELYGAKIYEALIITCFLFALPEILNHFSSVPPDAQPISLCVLGILVAVPLPYVLSGDLDEAWRTTFHFFKIGIYFVLLVSLVNSRARIQVFLSCLLVFCTAMTSVTVLQYFGFIELPTLLAALPELEINQSTGEQIIHRRMQGSGIFWDPNEFGVMLATAVPITLAQLSNRRGGVSRFLWLGPLALFLAGIYLTKSRGAFLALCAGLGTLMVLRYGWKKAILFGCFALPPLLLLGGRSTEISATTGTGQSRIQIWSDWMMDFRYYPLFGKGMGLGKEGEDYAKLAKEGVEVGKVAHNSFLHAFAEIGLFGGSFFLGAYFVAGQSVFRLRRQKTYHLDQSMAHLQPYLLGMIVAYTVGMLSLSVCFVVPTFMILGLATAYPRICPTYPPVPLVRFDGKLIGQIALLSIGYLAFMYAFIRVFIRWG